MIQKRGGRWWVVVQLPADPITGARRQLSGSAATEREAVRLERTFRLQAQDGVTGDIALARRSRATGERSVRPMYSGGGAGGRY